jgi:hypothetical protein
MVEVNMIAAVFSIDRAMPGFYYAIENLLARYNSSAPYAINN